jgi:hypothetical protein
MNNEKENLRDLLRKFYDEAEAAQVEDDIVRGERLLAENAPPRPRESTVSSIKLLVSGELAARHRRSVGVFVGAGLTAAAVILIAVGLFLIRQEQQWQNTTPEQVASQNVWEAEDFMVDDPNMAILAADVNALADEVLAMQLGENGSEGTSLDELEIEWLETDSDFWKG